MPTAGAADRDRQKRFSFGFVTGKKKLQHRSGIAQESFGVGVPKHKVADWLVSSLEWTQLLFPVRIGQEPDVEYEVGVTRLPFLKPNDRTDTRMSRSQEAV